MKIARVAALLLFPSLLHAQEIPPARQSSSDRIEAVNQSFDIENLRSRPWHLKMDVTVFDAQGKNPQEGTIEVWRSGDERRTSFVFGDASRTELLSSGKRYVGGTGSIPYHADMVLESVLHPGPDAENLKDAKPELRRQNFGKNAFDCIMLSHPIETSATVPLGLFPTYCLMRDTNSLGLSYQFGGDIIVFNAVGKFLDHSIPTALTIIEGTNTVAKAKVSTLSTFDPAPTEFQPRDSETLVSAKTPRIGGGVIAGNLLNKVPPIYPDGAKARHAGGTVILHAIIGRDGHIYSLRPVTFPDPDLVLAAIDAVRQWTYHPYLLNGVPTEVDTTITVNFNLNGG